MTNEQIKQIDLIINSINNILIENYKKFDMTFNRPGTIKVATYDSGKKGGKHFDLYWCEKGLVDRDRYKIDTKLENEYKYQIVSCFIGRNFESLIKKCDDCILIWNRNRAYEEKEIKELADKFANECL